MSQALKPAPYCPVRECGADNDRALRALPCTVRTVHILFSAAFAPSCRGTPDFGGKHGFPCSLCPLAETA